MTSPVLEVRDVSVVRTSDGASIVAPTSLTLGPGETLCIVGESGSGKTTLALALLGYTRTGTRMHGGSVSLDGTDLLSLGEKELSSVRGRLIAYVPQDPGTALNPVMSIGEQMLETHWEAKGDRRAALAEVMEAVGLPSSDEFLRRVPRKLSGGQQQRATIATAMVAQPSVLVFDEPTTGLDVKTQAAVLGLVKEICASRDVAAVYVTHDMGVVAEVADSIAVMYAGEFVEYGSREILDRPKHPYTRALLDAVPEVATQKRLVAIPGFGPEVGDNVPGCKFRARCTYASEACTAAPQLLPVGTGQAVRCFHAEARSRALEVALPPVADEAAPNEVALTVVGVTASYQETEVLHDVSLDLRSGVCTALVGESGSGKSTLSRLLVGLHPTPYEGEVRYGDHLLEGVAAKRSAVARREIQYVFQNPYASLHPRLSIVHSLVRARRHLSEESRADARQSVRVAIERVGLPANVLEAYPRDISGGQRQRVAIARALLADPKLLICDEITSALDVSVQAAVIELLRDLVGDGLSMLFVTHDIGVVRSLAQQVVVLRDGAVIEAGSANQIFTQPSSSYTKLLIDLAPDFHHRGDHSRVAS